MKYYIFENGRYLTSATSIQSVADKIGVGEKDVLAMLKSGERKDGYSVQYLQTDMTKICIDWDRVTRAILRKSGRKWK